MDGAGPSWQDVGALACRAGNTVPGPDGLRHAGGVGAGRMRRREGVRSSAGLGAAPMATLLAEVARGERLPGRVRKWLQELGADERHPKSMRRKLIVKIESAIALSGFLCALAERVRRWWPGAPGTSPDEEAIRSSIEAARALMEEVSTAILLSWGKGRATSERLHTDERPGCMFGCVGRDALGHDIMCARLRAAVSHAIGCVHPADVDLGAGVVGTEDPAEWVVGARRVVLATFVSHSACAAWRRSVGTFRQRRASADRLASIAREVVSNITLPHRGVRARRRTSG